MSEFLSRLDPNVAPAQRQACRHMATVALEPLAQTITEQDRDTRFSGPYADLGEQMYKAFAKTATDEGKDDLLVRSSTHHGFMVMTKMLSYMPSAYRQYCLSRGKTPDIDELAETLKTSQALPLVFANMDKRRNTTYETNFGLRGDPPVYEDNPFVFALNKKGELEVTPSRTTLQATKVEIAQRLLAGDLPNQDPTISCPAIGLLMRNLWDMAIDECATNPALFAASLAEQTAPQEVTYVV